MYKKNYSLITKYVATLNLLTYLFLGIQFLRITLVLLLQTTKNILMEINLEMH